jgi:putative FmdB family regulatory protein
MPVYAYECDTCKESVTIVRSITEPEKKPMCLLCSKTMTRDYKVTGVAFKGTGWGKEAR